MLIYLLIAVGIVVILLSLVTLFSRISLYFVHRYNISIWGGVLLFSLAVVCALLGYYSDDIPSLPLYFVAGFLTILIAVLDIHHAGFGVGLAALFLQGILSINFVFVLALFLLRIIIRMLFPQIALRSNRFLGLHPQRRYLTNYFII